MGDGRVVSGIISVHKDAGRTSFEVVSLVRRGTGLRKVGHAGTLDPQATGVLLVCLGQAVRISEYLMELSKVYRATIALGRATATYDAEGETTFVAGSIDASREAVIEALQGFVGEIQQTPPAFSAVKVDGQRSYRLARRGEPIALAPRAARIYRIELLHFEPPLVQIEVECGKGTYVRSLAHDIGRELGCGAHLASLVRTRVGPFDIQSATEIGGLEAAFQSDDWRDLVLPMDCGLAHLPSIMLGIADEQDLRHGQAMRLDVARPAPGADCRAYAEDGGLIAVVKYDAEAEVWRPRKVFG